MKPVCIAKQCWLCRTIHTVVRLHGHTLLPAGAIQAEGDAFPPTHTQKSGAQNPRSTQEPGRGLLLSIARWCASKLVCQQAAAGRMPPLTGSKTQDALFKKQYL